MNHENKAVFTALIHYLQAMDTIEISQLMTHKLQFYRQVLQIEGILTDAAKFNEKDAIKMIESYASIQLKDVL